MLALAAAAVLLIVGRNLAGVYSDYLWYESLGAGALWRARMSAVSVLRVGSGLLGALFAFANLYAVRQSVVSLVFPRRLANLEIGEEVPGKYLVAVAAALSVLIGALLTMPSDNWMSFVLARSNRPFNESDPFFGLDLGFFVYWLPLENAMWMWAFYLALVVGLVVILLYALTPSLKWQRGLYASTYVRRHVTVLVGVLLLLLAWSFRLDMYALLIDGSGADGAFSWADHRVGVPGDLVMALITLGASLIVLWAGFVGQLRLAAISTITAVGLAVVVREIAPIAALHSGTEAQRTIREQAYLATRATYSRRAFDVDAIARSDSTIGFPSATAALSAVPIWDPPALARATNSVRGGEDPSSLVGWRPMTNALVADVVQPASTNVGARAPWTALRVLASEADDRGSPVLAGSVAVTLGDELQIDPPLVFPGAPPTSVIADSLSRMSGTLLESFWSRLATAWSLQNVRLISGELPQPHPTLISHREVRDRVDMFVPFFSQGRAIDPLVLGDSLYWSIDLYSASDSYPLAKHFLIVGDDRSYLHHAGVAIVQAATGDVMIVADSILDPVAASWKARLPSLFTTWSALPSGLRTQIPPPVDRIVAQANAFGRFGVRGSSDAPRHVPVLDGADSALTSDHLPIMLPGSHSLGLAIPLVDDNERLRGLLISGSSPDLPTRWFPIADPGPRWNTVLDRLRSTDTTGGATREGPLLHGRVRVVPLRTGVAFFQPNFRWRAQTIPTLNRVAILSGDTLRALAPPFATAPAGMPTQSLSGDLRTQVNALYSVMRDALRRGDLIAFGKAFDALGRALNQPVARPAVPK